MGIELLFVTNYLTPNQRSLFAGTGAVVVSCRPVDRHRPWTGEASGFLHDDVSSRWAGVRLFRILRYAVSTDRILLGGSLRMFEIIVMAVYCRISGRPYSLWLERPTRSIGLTKKLLMRAALNHRGAIIAIGLLAQEAYRVGLGRGTVEVGQFPYSYGNRGPAAQADRDDALGSPTLHVALIASEYHRKGVDTFLEALDLIPRDPRGHRLFRVTIAGLRRPSDVVPESAIDWTGPIGASEIPHLLSSVDVLVVPSRFDGWAVVVEEAVSAGCAVVTTDTTGSVGLLAIDGLNGWVVPPESAPALSEALTKLHRNRVELKRFRANSRMLAAHFGRRYSYAGLLAEIDRIHQPRADIA